MKSSTGIYYLAVPLILSAHFVMAEERNQEMCALNEQLAAAKPMHTIFRADIGHGNSVLNAMYVYRCYDMFTMVGEYGPNEQAKKIGQDLWQTGSRFHVVDWAATSLSYNQAAFSGVYGDQSSDRDVGFYWAKRRMQEVNHDALVSLLETRDANAIASTIGMCFSYITAMQKRSKDHIGSQGLSDKAASIKEGSDIEHDYAGITELMYEIYFRFEQPNKEDVMSNFKVGLNLAPTILISGMAWENDGYPHLDSHLEARSKIVDGALETFCED